MRDQDLRERITIDPEVMVGQPCIRGTRLTVRVVLNMLAHGATVSEILQRHSHLTHDDVAACLLHAVDMLECDLARSLTAAG